MEPPHGINMLAIGTGALGAILNPDAPSKEQRRLMDCGNRRRDGRQDCLDDLQLYELILLVLARADSLHDNIDHCTFDLAHLHDLAANVPVRNELLNARERHLDNAWQLGLARQTQRHEEFI